MKIFCIFLRKESPNCQTSELWRGEDEMMKHKDKKSEVTKDRMTPRQVSDCLGHRKQITRS